MNPDGTFKEGWTQALQDKGLTRLANKAVLVKNETDLLTSLDHALGLVGKRPEVGPPKPGASVEDIASYRNSVGIPADPDGYELNKFIPDGFVAGPEMAEYAKLMHENHVPKEVAQKLAERYGNSTAEGQNKMIEEFNGAMTKRASESEARFKAEWGEHYETRFNDNNDFIKSRTDLDLKDPSVQMALSIPGIVNIIDMARMSLREGTLPGEKTTLVGTQSARQQAQEIISKNPNWERDPAVHKRVMELYAVDAQRSKRQGKA
jgi:hypothetical protein